jgi:L,D-transpeptidase ErfK/SrfK
VQHKNHPPLFICNTGPFKIVAKIENPTWYVPPSIQEEMRREGQVIKTCVPSGPDNPLGTRWLGLSIPRFGIHGTNDPTSIYHFDLYGCIVGNNDDVAQLFDDVAVGSAGVLVYRRLLIATVSDQIFLETHPDIYKRQPNIQQQFEMIIKFFKLESMIDRDLAQETMRRQEEIARNITRTNRSRNSR